MGRSTHVFQRFETFFSPPDLAAHIPEHIYGTNFQKTYASIHFLARQ
jgi:hypothetical protein